MKIRLKKRITLYLIVILILSILQGFFINVSLKSLVGNESVSKEIKTTLLIFLFFQTALIIVLISHLPKYLTKLLSGVGEIISDIAKGKYNISLDIDKYRDNYDAELVTVVESIGKMLEVILTFDKMKKDKILEQKGRITGLINLSNNGFMIVDGKGNLVYTNYQIEYNFPSIKQDTNILDSNYGHDEDNHIKNYVADIVENQSRVRPRQFYVDSMKRHITLKCEIVRDSSGDFIGAVIGIFNIENKPEQEAN